MMDDGGTSASEKVEAEGSSPSGCKEIKDRIKQIDILTGRRTRHYSSRPVSLSTGVWRLRGLPDVNRGLAKLAYMNTRHPFNWKRKTSEPISFRFDRNSQPQLRAVAQPAQNFFFGGKTFWGQKCFILDE